MFASVDVLLRPAVLVRARRGKGEVLLSQFRWAEALPAEQKNSTFISSLWVSPVAWYSSQTSVMMKSTESQLTVLSVALKFSVKGRVFSPLAQKLAV